MLIEWLDESGLLVGGTLVIFSLILLIWALIDCTQRNFRDSIIKLVWVIIVIFLPLVGPLMYFAIGIDQGQRLWRK